MCSRLGNHIRLPEFQSAVGEGGMRIGLEVRTGCAEEGCAVDGEEDGDPVLDCE